MELDERLTSLTPAPATGHGWDGTVAILDRRLPLPDRCILSGESTQRKVSYLFHWKRDLFYAGSSPVEALFRGVIFYFGNVPKATLALPLSRKLDWNRKLAWVLVGIAMLFAVATVIGLLVGQERINAMPAGPDKTFLNDWLIPGIALLGFAGIMAPSAIAYQIMPMPTKSLKVLQITESHVWLAGVAEEFGQAL